MIASQDVYLRFMLFMQCNKPVGISWAIDIAYDIDAFIS